MANLLPPSLMERMPVIKVSDFVTSDQNAVQTTAIQSAINAQIGTNDRYATRKLVYFEPDRQYLIDNTLLSRINNPWSDGWRAGLTFLGINKQTTTIKLAANATGYQDPQNLKPMIMFGSENGGLGAGDNPIGYGNQAFQHEVKHLTIDLNGNPGAIGVDFLASNRGCIDDVDIINSNQTGVAIGCTRSLNGPALIKDVTIENCAVAFDWEGGYTLTLSNLTCTNQGEAVIRSENSVLTIEGLKSYNNVPVIQQFGENGLLNLIDSEFRLADGQSRNSATGFIAEGRIEVQNLKSNAYNNPLQNTRNGTVTIAESSLPVVGGMRSIDRYITFPNKSQFPSEPRPLATKQAPDFWSDNVADCAVLSDYFESGDTAAQTLQRAIDSGKKIIMMDTNQFYLDGDVIVRASVQKIIGFQCQVAIEDGTTPTLYFDGGSADFCVFESLWIDVPIVHRSSKALHIKEGYISGGYSNTSAGTGDLFVTDCVCQPIVVRYGQKTYFRQFNSEFNPVSLDLYDSSAWILGMKTERSTQQGEINIRATNSELQLIGGVWYPLGGVQNDEPITPAVELIDCENVLMSWLNFGPNLYYFSQVRETINGTTLDFLGDAINLSYQSPACVSYSGGLQLSSPSPSPTPTPSSITLPNINADTQTLILYCGVTPATLSDAPQLGELDLRSQVNEENTNRVFYLEPNGVIKVFIPLDPNSQFDKLLPNQYYIFDASQDYSLPWSFPSGISSTDELILQDIQDLID